MATTTTRRLILTTLQPLFFTLLVLFHLSFPTSATQPSSITTIDVQTANGLLTRPSSPYHLLDVRTAKEFAASHIRGAVNVPYIFFTQDGDGRVRNPDFLEGVEKEFNKGDPIVVVCLGGVRSFKAAGELAGAGYKDVKDLGGGVREWVDKGLPLVKSSSSARFDDGEL